MTWWRRPTKPREQIVDRHARAPLLASPYVDASEPSLFAFLEESLAGGVVTAPLVEHAEAIARSLELANADWPEPEAARELLHLVGGERRVLERADRVLQGSLLRTMIPDVMGVRASRVVQAALKQTPSSARRRPEHHDGPWAL
jgi:hypothetical protein